MESVCDLQRTSARVAGLTEQLAVLLREGGAKAAQRTWPAAVETPLWSAGPQAPKNWCAISLRVATLPVRLDGCCWCKDWTPYCLMPASTCTLLLVDVVARKAPKKRQLGQAQPPRR